MFVKLLDYDNDEDFTYRVEGGGAIENPAWADICDAILSLNGRNRSVVVLCSNRDDEYEERMEIGGGGDNQLDVGYRITEAPDDPDWQLCNPSQSSEEGVEIVAGLASYYARSSCVSVSEVLKAAETYAKFGRKDETLQWREYR